MSRQITFHIDHPLRRSGSKNTCRPFTRNSDRTACTFAAAHSQNNGSACNFQQSMFRADCNYRFVLQNFQNHRINQGFYFRFIFDHFNATISISGSSQLFFKMMQAKTIMNALLQNAA